MSKRRKRALTLALMAAAWWSNSHFNLDREGASFHWDVGVELRILLPLSPGAPILLDVPGLPIYFRAGERDYSLSCWVVDQSCLRGRQVRYF